MAKQPSITDVSSGFLSSQAQNLNNENIRQAFDNTLSRDGSTPNTMEADLDMNSNDIINVDNVHADTLVLNGVTITPTSSVGSAATASADGLMSKEDKAKLDGLSTKEFNTHALAEASDTDSEYLFIAGYTSVGDQGHGWYKKVASEPFHEGKLQTSASWYELIISHGWVYDKQFGVIGDGSTDDTAALQNAVNFVIHNTAKNVAAECALGLLASEIRTTDTIHFLHGDGSASIHVKAFARDYRPESPFNGCTINSEVTDRMAISICGARHAVFENVNVQGRAASGLSLMDRGALDWEDEATWDSELTTAGFTSPGERYAPRAGWMVDGYCGTKPSGASGSGTEPYPTPTLPSFVSTGTDGYGRTSSSRIDFINCGSSGFELGFGVGSSQNGLQGDYVSFTRCHVERCKIVHSVGQSQSRGVVLDQLLMSVFYLGITNNTHGAQVGRYASKMSIEGGVGVNLVKFGATSTLGSVDVHGEFEAIHRIGDFATGGSSDQTIRFQGCKFNFIHPERESYPANVLKANNSNYQIEFAACVFLQFGDVCSFFQDKNVVLTNQCRFVSNTPSTAVSTQGVAERSFHNSTAGFSGDLDTAVKGLSIGYQPYNIDTGAAGTVTETGYSLIQTSRVHCVPIWSKNWSHSDSSLGLNNGSERRPHKVVAINNSTLFSGGTFNTSTATITGASHTITVDTAKQQGGQVGDIVKCRQTGTVLRIETKDFSSNAVTYKVLTNVRISNANRTIRGNWAISTAYSVNDVVKSSTDDLYYICTVAGTSSGNDSDLSGSSDSGVTWTNVTWEIVDTDFSLSSGNSNTAPCSIYVLSQPLYGSKSNASSTVGGLRTDTSTTVTSVTSGITVGDSLVGYPARNAGTVVDDRLRITTAGATLVLANVSSVDIPDHEFIFFSRAKS